MASGTTHADVVMIFRARRQYTLPVAPLDRETGGSK
jgi:hypothetical protein